MTNFSILVNWYKLLQNSETVLKDKQGVKLRAKFIASAFWRQR